MRDYFWKFMDWLDDRLEAWRQSAVEKSQTLYTRFRETELPRRRKSPAGEPRRRLRSRPLRYLEHPVLNTLLGAILFLGVCVAGIAPGNPLATWSLWFPLVFFLLAALPGMFDFRAVRRAFRAVILVALAFGFLLLRLWVAVRGPLPHASIREITEFFAALLMSYALWVTATRQVIAVFFVWIAALCVILATRMLLPASDLPGRSILLFRPDFLPVILSILWAFVALGGAVGHRKEAEDWAEMVHRKRTSSFGVIQSHVFALLLGWILAWFCMAFTEIQSAAAGKSDAAEFALAQEAVGRLWPKSLLFGWGRGCLVRLTEAVTEPMPAKFSGWGGWLGTLGAFGLSSAVFAVFLSFTLMWLAYRRNRIYRLSLSSAPQLCLLAAQTLLALIVLGGPDSSVPIFFLFGWIGLGLASGSYSKPLPGKPFEDEESYSQLGMLFRFLAAVCLTMLFLAGTIAALGPVWSASMIGSLKLEDFRSAGLGRKLGTAKLLSPWDPEVEIKEAMRLREELQKTPIQNWDENLFQRTCDAYRRAQNLDRFDPKIPIQLANLQALAKRPDDAIKTILRALAVTPSDEVLLDWLFLYANRQNNSDVVMDMINRGLQLQPSSSKWWQRRYRFEFMTGRGPQAGHTLNTALTAAPGDLNLLHAAMDRNLLAGRSQPVTQ